MIWSDNIAIHSIGIAETEGALQQTSGYLSTFVLPSRRRTRVISIIPRPRSSFLGRLWGKVKQVVVGVFKKAIDIVRNAVFALISLASQSMEDYEEQQQRVNSSGGGGKYHNLSGGGSVGVLAYPAMQWGPQYGPPIIETPSFTLYDGGYYGRGIVAVDGSMLDPQLAGQTVYLSVFVPGAWYGEKLSIEDALAGARPSLPGPIITSLWLGTTATTDAVFLNGGASYVFDVGWQRHEQTTPELVRFLNFGDIASLLDLSARRVARPDTLVHPYGTGTITFVPAIISDNGITMFSYGAGQEWVDTTNYANFLANYVIDHSNDSLDDFAQVPTVGRDRVYNSAPGGSFSVAGFEFIFEIAAKILAYVGFEQQSDKADNIIDNFNGRAGDAYVSVEIQRVEISEAYPHGTDDGGLWIDSNGEYAYRAVIRGNHYATALVPVDDPNGKLKFNFEDLVAYSYVSSDGVYNQPAYAELLTDVCPIPPSEETFYGGG